MDKQDIPFLTTAELSDLIRTREVSPVEATSAYLDRIDALNFKFNSYLTVSRREAMAAAEEHRLPDGGRVLLENIFRLDPGGDGDIAPGAECPFLGREAWVASDGRFNPCCAPDALRRTLGDFGNVGETGLSAIWAGTDYQSLRENYLARSLCRGCNMRRPVDR